MTFSIRFLQSLSGSPVPEILVSKILLLAEIGCGGTAILSECASLSRKPSTGKKPGLSLPNCKHRPISKKDKCYSYIHLKFSSVRKTGWISFIWNLMFTLRATTVHLGSRVFVIIKRGACDIYLEIYAGVFWLQSKTVIHPNEQLLQAFPVHSNTFRRPSYQSSKQDWILQMENVDLGSFRGKKLNLTKCLLLSVYWCFHSSKEIHILAMTVSFALKTKWFCCHSRG